MEKLVMSVEDAGRMLGVSRPVAYRLAQSEDFPAFRVGRRVMVSCEGLRQWVLLQAGAVNEPFADGGSGKEAVVGYVGN